MVKQTLIVLFVLMIVVGCHHRRKTNDCLKIDWSAYTCGDRCEDPGDIRRAIELTIAVYGERHGNVAIAERSLRRMQVTWHDGIEFYDSILSHVWVTGVTYSKTAIGVACGYGLNSNAFFEECVHLIEYNVHGRMISHDDPEWSGRSETIRILQRTF